MKVNRYWALFKLCGAPILEAVFSDTFHCRSRIATLFSVSAAQEAVSLRRLISEL